MEDARDVIEQYIPAEFVGVGLLVVAGILISIGAGFAGGIWMFNLPNSLAAVWIGVGLLIVALAVYFGREIVNEVRAWGEHRRTLETNQSEALLREAQPQPYVIESRPIVVNGSALPESPRMINGIPEAAFDYFITQICRGVAHSQGKWDKMIMPGDYEITTFEAYDRLIVPLVACGFITGRDGDKRQPGILTCRDKDLILARVREWEARRPR